jgi:hypothetical protein
MKTTELKDLKLNDETPVKCCPWCGDAPSFNELGYGGMSIRCQNSGCRISPETSWCDSAEEALTMWNTRHG